MNQTDIFRVIAIYATAILVPVVVAFVIFARWSKKDFESRTEDQKRPPPPDPHRRR